MSRIAWILFTVALVLLAALFVKKYVLPARVRGGEVAPADSPGVVGEAPQFVPPLFVAPPLEMPATAAVAQADANRRKEMAALAQARERAELARRQSGDLTPRVETIVATPDNGLCVLIDDTLVHEGGMVQGYRVRKINATSVEFEKDGKVWVQKVD